MSRYPSLQPPALPEAGVWTFSGISRKTNAHPHAAFSWERPPTVRTSYRRQEAEAPPKPEIPQDKPATTGPCCHKRQEQGFPTTRRGRQEPARKQLGFSPGGSSSRDRQSGGSGRVSKHVQTPGPGQRPGSQIAGNAEVLKGRSRPRSGIPLARPIKESQRGRHPTCSD